MMFHILDRLTFGWLGWIVGVAAALAFIFIVVGVIQKGLMLITANTGLWAFATGLVAKGMALIGLEMTAASWGLNLLVATIIAGLVAILAWLSKITFGQTADKFNKMKEDAQEIAKSMKQAATAGSPKVAMFGTMEGSSAIRKANNQQKQWQDQMLEETRKNREANEAAKEKRSSRERIARGFNSSIVFSP
jgi:signal transduction histidine kinase